MKLTNTAITLRPIAEEDISFLTEVYASTREPEMARLPFWTDLMKQEFVESQFKAQHEYYQNNYTGADFWVIEYENKAVGRLYLDSNFRGKGMRIIDISILPQYRNRGFGQGIFEDLKRKSVELNVPLSIHVEAFNPAKELYTRLGFKLISETNGIYHLMEWKHTI